MCGRNYTEYGSEIREKRGGMMEINLVPVTFEDKEVRGSSMESIFD